MEKAATIWPGLAGKTALVTGTSSGLGALLLLSDHGRCITGAEIAVDGGRLVSSH